MRSGSLNPGNSGPLQGSMTNAASFKKWPANAKIGGVARAWPSYGLSSMKTEFAGPSAHQESACSPLCPLNRVRTGIAVRVRQLCASPELANRLREIGFCEDRIIKLLTSNNN